MSFGSEIFSDPLYARISEQRCQSSQKMALETPWYLEGKQARIQSPTVHPSTVGYLFYSSPSISSSGVSSQRKLNEYTRYRKWRCHRHWRDLWREVKWKPVGNSRTVAICSAIAGHKLAAASMKTQRDDARGYFTVNIELHKSGK